MVESILVPTDFSKNAWKALQYAATLATQTDRKLIVVHAFSQAEATVNERMVQLLNQLKVEFPKLDCHGLCNKGDLNEVLSSIVKKQLPKLIIMGTKGASGLKDLIMGSNTLSIITQFAVPVLAVPENNNFYTINKVGLLSNYKNSEIDVMRKSIAVLPSNFKLMLLHIRENENDDEEIILNSWTEIVKDKTDLKKVDYKIGIGSDIPSIVNDLIQKEQINLLVVTNNGKSFFKNLFNRNLIKAIALRPQIPILFIKA